VWEREKEEKRAAAAGEKRQAPLSKEEAEF
jgi:hypothetical protein